MPRTEKEFASYLQDAISNNFLMCALITSQTQGKVKSDNLPFGLGKTTLAFWLSYYMNGKSWDRVFEYLNYNPYQIVCLLEPGSPRKNCAVWDAVQATAPAEQGVPKVIRKLSSFLSETRPEIACLVMTASNINAISSPLRKLVVFEVIVAERGYYEVQKITFHKNFKQPQIDLSRLQYLEEGEFQELPKEVYEKYEAWRVSQKLKLYPALKTEVMEYVRMHEEVRLDDLTKWEGPVIRGGGGYLIRVPQAIGEKLHKQEVEVSLATKG